MRGKSGPHPMIVEYYNHNGYHIKPRERYHIPEQSNDLMFWDIRAPLKNDNITDMWCVAIKLKKRGIQYRIYPDLTFRSETLTLRLIKLKAFL